MFISILMGRSESLVIDTLRFELTDNDSVYIISDTYLGKNIKLPKDVLISTVEEFEEEATYVSSFKFSSKINSFHIGNGLIGLHLVSFEAMRSGSAQAAAGRDLFLIYNTAEGTIFDTILDFGVTKRRSRYMGCLFAESSHFILADIDNDGSIDIGVITEIMKCDPLQNDMLTDVYFSQKDTDWYVFTRSNWIKYDLPLRLHNYIDLPLIDIKLNPIDFFGNIQWKNYDPINWNRKSEVPFYPEYRLKLINGEK